MNQCEPIILKPRSIPYPYRGILAICSDLDETVDRTVYCEIMRFLNTRETTPMGEGAGLEVGNSIYFDMPKNQFSYWNTDETGRQMIRTLIRSGHIDCIHSFGDLATSREDAARSLDELDHYQCYLKAWVDHGTAATNFGADIMQGHGDEPGHRAYHADMTTQFGVQYVWRGRVSSVIGQEVSPSLKGIWRTRHPLISARTIAKEWTKRRLGMAGNEKYHSHASNRALFSATLRDGRKIYEFMRENPCWQGVGRSATAEGLGHVLTPSFLNQLATRNGCCILYTHLGKVKDPHKPFDTKTCAALYHLSDRMEAGEILTATTVRVLDYLQMRKTIQIYARLEKSVLHINLCRKNNLPLDGVSFEVPLCNDYVVTCDEKTVACNVYRYADSAIIALPWPKLEFPEI
jgi:hypothetical protein